jgi:hypothetical protein
MPLNTFLRQLDFHPEFCVNHDQYIHEIQSHLGKEQGDKFLKKIDSMNKRGTFSEEKLTKMIDSDVKLLKLVFSTQIQISSDFLENMIPLIEANENKPESVLELGGANGWALAYLKKKFDSLSECHLVDSNPTWGVVDPIIQVFWQDYAEYAPTQKFDLIISILGVKNGEWSKLLKPIVLGSTADTQILLGLRINPSDLNRFLNDCEACQLAPKLTGMAFFQSCDQHFRIIELQKTENKSISPLERKHFKKLFAESQELTTVCGWEAMYLAIDLDEYDTIYSSETSDQDVNENLKLILAGDTLYRVWKSALDETIVEFPVKLVDPLNELENMSQRAKMLLKD